MGCCVSAGRGEEETPAAMEEEKVKEVVIHSISETPISVPLPETTNSQAQQHSILLPSTPTPTPTPKQDLLTPEISEITETRTVSTATTTTTVFEDDAQSKPNPPPPRRGEKLSRSPAAGHSRTQLRPRPVRERPSDRQQNVNAGVLRRGGLRDGPTRRSPGRATGGRRSPIKKRNDGVRVEKEEASGGGTAKKEEGGGCSPPETIDNPYVSLECFIFL
ncbi:PREDICTED: uncharacterized protein LOC104804072 [Tarenaya hassleriana]|uniref:uncharacterized protein LOC104804072 n=1 Tax=Tarenaya hassleriana TaxID=28532 RepID=UPI00053C1705|nr:PREDICTED: uncharacterized protein LOC104804072 [Tarenaya hassleriana]